MIDLPSLKPINVGGREINAYLIVGVVVLLAVSGISLSFNLAPTSTFDSGLRGLDLEIFKKIGVGLKINTLAEATQSIGSIAQDLEKARGTGSNLNESFLKKYKSRLEQETNTNIVEKKGFLEKVLNKEFFIEFKD